MSKEMDAILGPVSKAVSTKKGKVVVRELVIEDLQGIMSALVTLFQGLDFSDLQNKKDAKTTGLEVISRIGRSEDLLAALKELLTQLTDSDDGFFDRFPITDLAKVISAFFEVNDMEEIRKAFFAVMDAMAPVIQQASSQDLKSEKKVILSRSAEPASESSQVVPATD